VKNFLSLCASFDFGRPALSEGETDFYRSLNGSIIRLLQTLPASTQADAMILYMHFAGIRIGEELDFFRHYHIPVWSVLYWMLQAPWNIRTRSIDDMGDGVRAHAMTMLLHSLDNFLCDGGLPVSHTSLLIRSQAWRAIHESLGRFCADIAGGERVVNDFFNTYYAAMCGRAEPDCIEDYCANFKRQAATGLIVPLLAAMKYGADDDTVRSIRGACEAFFTAWRLMDDLRDIADDIRGKKQTAPFFLLSRKGRRLWDEAGVGPVEARIGPLVRAMQEERIIPAVVRRIGEELEAAQSICEQIGMSGLGREFAAMREPLTWNNKA
jgi:hypothetical protein